MSDAIVSKKLFFVKYQSFKNRMYHYFELSNCDINSSSFKYDTDKSMFTCYATIDGQDLKIVGRPSVDKLAVYVNHSKTAYYM